MKRIRDYILARVLEDITGKKIEYINEEDLARIEKIIIRNVEGAKLTRFKDIADFEFLKNLSEGVYLEFSGFDLSGMKFEFNNPIDSFVVKNCRIDDLTITVKDKTKGYYLELNEVRNDKEIDLSIQMPECSNLVIIGKATTELTREYTAKEITENMKSLIPEYMELPREEQAHLLKKKGYLSIYPQRMDITGIDRLKLLKKISLNYMEIDEIRFSEITKYSKDIRALDEIYFKECTFNEAPVLYKQPVKRLVVNSCDVKRKDLLPNFVGVEAIVVIDTKGAELPKLNEPKLLKGLKFVNSEVNLGKIANVKYLNTLVVLEQNFDDLKFVKKLKHLRCLVVSKDAVRDTSILSKFKKLEFIQVEKDEKSAPYNELFV